jgi:Tfp pilus assembly protein PilV
MKPLIAGPSAVHLPSPGSQVVSGRTKPVHETRGFTLVEVAFASFVMALAIATSLTALQYSYKSIDRARYTTLAGQILQSQMEKLRLLTWAQLTDSVNGPIGSPTFTPDVSSVSAAQLSHFTCTQTIADAPSPFNGTMKDITLTATWVGTDGRTQSLTYMTRYAQNGISDFFYTTH